MTNTNAKGKTVKMLTALLSSMENMLLDDVTVIFDNNHLSDRDCHAFDDDLNNVLAAIQTAKKNIYNL